MKLRPYKMLVLDDKEIAIRFQAKKEKEDGIFIFDIDLRYLKDIGDLSVLGLQKSKLKEHGNMYLTEEEIKTNVTYPDLSEDKEMVGICRKALLQFIQHKTQSSNQVSSTNNKKEKKFVLVSLVKVYDSTIKDFVEKEFEAEVYAENALKAIKKVKDMYEKDLGVNRDDIKVKVKTN